MKKIILKKNEDRRIKEGHLWIFSNEIAEPSKEIDNGDMIEIYDNSNTFLGTAFYNRTSLIAARIISRSKVDSLENLFRMRLNNASLLRKSIYPERTSYRFVFSEGDLLPGLIIDKYNNTFVLQVHSAGMEKNIQIICDILKQDYNAENIFTLNEEYFRKLEGLPIEDKIYLGEMKNEVISDGKLKYTINFVTGQKTGFYFDQSDNRFFIEKLVKGKKVMDAFCNSGGFGMHALSAGADTVTFIDSSASEIEAVKNNLGLNELEKGAEFMTGDLFDILEEKNKNNSAGHPDGKSEKFDVILLDPPAFARSRKSIPTAIKGYEKINRLAMNLVNEGGFLVTSSCSFHLKEEDFITVIKRAAFKTGKSVQLVYNNRASLDHPMLAPMEETSYLKFMVLRINSVNDNAK